MINGNVNYDISCDEAPIHYETTFFKILRVISFLTIDRRNHHRMDLRPWFLFIKLTSSASSNQTNSDVCKILSKSLHDFLASSSWATASFGRSSISLDWVKTYAECYLTLPESQSVSLSFHKFYFCIVLRISGTSLHFRRREEEGSAI